MLDASTDPRGGGHCVALTHLSTVYVLNAAVNPTIHFERVTLDFLVKNALINFRFLEFYKRLFKTNLQEITL